MTTPLSSRVNAGPTVRPVDTDALGWRPAEFADLAAIAELEREMALADHPNFTFSAAEIDEELHHSGFELATDSLVGTDAASGRIIAYGLCLFPASQETVVRAQLYFGGVHPEFRGRGIGRELLAWQVSRALQQLASSDKELPGRIGLANDERAPSACHLAERFGFVATRWFVTQERDLADPIAEIGPQPGIRILPYSSERSEAARLAKNDAFRDHWGSQPTDRESWDGELALSTFAPQHSFLALSESDEIAGLLLTHVSEEDWALQGFSSGYIDLLGVPRAWRNRRIAPALLARAFASFRAAGFDRAVLDVDTDNPTGAVGLYSRMGFVPTTTRVTYLREF